MMMFIGMLGAQEMIIIFIILLFIFGGKKIPELAKGIGKGIREFKKATKDVENEIDIDESEDDARNNHP